MSNSIEDIIFSWLHLFKEHAKLFALEAKLARRSIFPLIILLIIFLLLISSVWFMLVIGVGYITYFYTNSTGLGLGASSIFILIFLAITCALIVKYFKRMQFQKTREHIDFYKFNVASNHHDKD